MKIFKKFQRKNYDFRGYAAQFYVNLTQAKVIQEEGTSIKEMFQPWAVVAHTLNSSTQEKLFCFLSMNILPACMHVHCAQVHAEIRGRHE